MPEALFAIAGALAVLTALLWVVRRPPEAEPGEVALRYEKLVPGVGVLAAVVVPLAVALLALASSSDEKPLDDEAKTAVGGILVGFLAVAGPLLLIGCHTRVFVTPDGVTKFSPLFPAATLRWDDMTGLGHSMGGGYVIIRGKGGRKIRVSDYIGGREALSAALGRHGVTHMGRKPPLKS